VSDFNTGKAGHLTVVLLASLVTGACDRHEQGSRDAIQNRILNRGLPGEPRTLDPQLSDDTYSNQVLRDLYEGLTAEDRSGHIVPGIAQSWDIDASGTTYTFHLRAGARWSNGDPILAEEFVLGLRRAVDPKTASGSAEFLIALKGAPEIIQGHEPVSELGVVALDSSILRIELEHPAPYLLQILAEPIASPWHAPRGGEPNSAPPSPAIFDGPYVLTGRIQGSVIELSKNPYYWDAAHVPISAVRYVIQESASTELRGYESGAIDLTYTVPTPDFARLKRTLGTELQTAPLLGTLYLALNLTEPPLKNNTELRQAISMAIDRDFIAKYITLGALPAYSFVPHGLGAYQPPDYPWSEWPRKRRLEVARDLYARSGYSVNHPLRLRLYYGAGENTARIMIAVAETLKENLGIDCELLAEEFQVFLENRKDRSRWDVARLAWWADYEDPESFLDVFAAGSPQNDPGYRSPEFNRILDVARVESDPKRRLESLRRAEGLLLNDYAIIPLYFYVTARLVKPYLGGAQISLLNHTYSKHLFWH
jgi:oligopeptide transport system substrate-binding protein